MIPETLSLSAERLRREFDQAFAEPPPAREGDAERLLAIGLGGEPYALRLAELAGLSAGRDIRAGGGSAPGYLGLAGLRGALVPVWDLALLLGHPRQGARPRWLALAAGEAAWGLAFERFDGMLSAPKGDLLPYAGEGPASAFASQACSTGGVLRPILRLSSMLELIKGRIGR